MFIQNWAFRTDSVAAAQGKLRNASMGYVLLVISEMSCRVMEKSRQANLVLENTDDEDNMGN